MKRFILPLLVILLASPHVVYSQCTDSSTVAQINLYLLKGAEARERLNICREYRRIDSAIIVQQEAVMAAQDSRIKHQTKRVALFQATTLAVFILFLLAL